MSKTRFSTTDTKAMVRDIRATLLGQRVANIYDLNDKTYLFKFAVPGKSEKQLLLLESGVRFHTTKYARDKNDLPSSFVMKLRKHIRTRRLEDVRQLCNDRVVDFKFGSGDQVFHIILELYANGNIILTDGNYEILALLRSHQFEEDVAIRVNEIYPMAFATTLDRALLNRMPIPSVDSTEMTEEQKEQMFIPEGQKEQKEQTEEEGQNDSSILSMDPSAFISWATQKDEESSNNYGIKITVGKKNKAKKMTMRQLLLSRDSGVSSYGPEILDHCLLTAGVKASTKVCDFLLESDVIVLSSRILSEIITAESLLLSLDLPGQHGYILYTESLAPIPAIITPIPAADLGPLESGLSGAIIPQIAIQKDEIIRFIDFVPRMFKQHEGQLFMEFSSFDETVDEYYCKVDEQKLERVAFTAEETARKKVNKVKDDQNSLIVTLERQQRKMEEGALLVEIYAEDVDKCTLVINSALAAGMSWDDIDTMVKVEAKKGNPIASLVSRLRLERNFIVLKLSNLYAEDSDEDDEEEEIENSQKSKLRDSGRLKVVEVEIDLTMSAYANVTRMYGHKKVAQAKEIKTLQASQRALVAVEVQSAKTLEAQKIRRNLQAVRKVHWFEKFNWFITSEGYLVLSGRDAQQNEQLVKRYLRPGDVYVHAELSGASSCIVRCKVVQSAGSASSFKPISPFALQEAGTMTVCRSGAWGAKIVTSAWWVFGTQVSKTAPTGEFLPTGSFMIYGKKNFLPPMPLEMGFGVMFRLDDGSVTRHSYERKDKSSSSFETESVLSEAASRYGIEFEGLGLKEVDTDDEGEEGEDGEGSEEGENEGQEDDEAEDDVKGVSAISISAFQLSSIPESADDADIEDDTLEEKEKVEKGDEGNTEAVPDVSEKTDEGKEEDKGSGRLTAKERRLLKKSKGGDVVAATAAVKSPTSDVKGIKSEKGEKIYVGDDNEEKEGSDEDENIDEGEEEEVEEEETETTTNAKNAGQNALKSKGKGNQKSNETLNQKGNEKGNKSNQNNQNSKKEAAVSPRPLAGLPPSAANKKKFLNKKKGKKYADQDDDEKELAMLALGHVQIGEKYGDKEKILKKEREAIDRVKRQEKAGIKIVKDVWSDLMLLLAPNVREVVIQMVSSGVMREGEIDGHEIRTLSSFSEESALIIIDLFRQGDHLTKVGNKSGFLAGIMRRYSKDTAAAAAAAAAVVVAVSNSSSSNKSNKDSNSDSIDVADVDINHPLHEGESENEKNVENEIEGEGGEVTMSRRERKKKDQEEIQLILEEEGIFDEEAGKQEDEINKLTGKPLPEDVLLYAVPVCGPYSAIRNFKYSVKLTPGTMKKGKAAKQAIDVFTRGKECSPVEKALMRSLNDPEMVAIMIGDVKLSMPGLYQVQRVKKGKK